MGHRFIQRRCRDSGVGSHSGRKQKAASGVMCARSLRACSHTIREGIFTAGDIYCLIPRSPLPSSLIHNCSTPMPISLALRDTRDYRTYGLRLHFGAGWNNHERVQFPDHTVLPLKVKRSQRKEDKIVKFLPVFPLAIIPFLRRDPILRA